MGIGGNGPSRRRKNSFAQQDLGPAQGEPTRSILSSRAAIAWASPERVGTPYVELRVPMRGSVTEFDVRTNCNSQLGGDFLRRKSVSKGVFQSDETHEVPRGERPEAGPALLEDSGHPSAQNSEKPRYRGASFQLRYARHMNQRASSWPSRLGFQRDEKGRGYGAAASGRRPGDPSARRFPPASRTRHFGPEHREASPNTARCRRTRAGIEIWLIC